MRAYVTDDYYDTTIPNCCGIEAVGDFHKNDDPNLRWNKESFPEIKHIRSRGCGIFISTLLGSQWAAYRDLRKHHTLLYRTGPHKNKSSSATYEGKEKGVYLCVFKYGKDGK